MKKLYIFLPLIVIFVSCQTAAPIYDVVSIQDTAIAVAVAQTQSAWIVSTVSAQETQITMLIEPTIAITPTQNLLMIEDNGIKVALMTVLNKKESEFYYSQGYNDGNLATGYYSFQSVSTVDDGLWFAQRDSNGLWGIFYISHGIPACEELQSFNLDRTIPIDCLDVNGNQIMWGEWLDYYAKP